MKKYFVVLVAAVAILAVASPSLAQFKSWGHMEVETYWSNKGTYFDSDKSDNRRAIAERFRFYLQYGDPKTVRAVIGFEADSVTWGEASGPSAPYANNVANQGSNNAGTATGAPGATDRNHMGALATDQIALEIKHAYLDFVIPNTPLSLMAGLQNYAVGGSLGRFFENVDAPGITLSGNFAPHTIQAVYFKEYKGNTYKDNDGDMYMLRYLLNQKMFNVEAWFAYENDRRSQTEAWSWVNTTGSTTDYVLRRTLTDRTYDAQPWWAGASAPITFGNLIVTPTFIYEGGKARKYFVSGGTDVKVEAWLANLEATYKLGPGLAFTAQGFYATGNDTGKTDKQTMYTTPNASEARNVFGNGWSVFYFENTEVTYYGHKQELFGGLAFGRLTGTYSPLSWLELQGTYLYIWDTAKSGKVNGVEVTSGSNSVGRTDADKSTVGQEINLITTLKIYDNIRYKIGAGVFFPGDVYKGNYSRSTNDSPGDTAWTILTNINYAF